MDIRTRTDADLDTCVELARVVHALDGYPVFLPTDLRTFLASPGAYGAWAAEYGGAIVGHVALHPYSTAPVMDRASEALGQPVDRLGVVARLLVAPSARRRGVGQALLEVASRDAVARGLWPILDVATTLHGGIHLYESCGWTCAGQVTVRLGEELTVDELVYLGPHRPGGHVRSVDAQARRR
jgi:GNAT superfamily N-acetyltransferase